MHPRIASQSNNFDWPGGLCPSRSCVSCEVIYCSLELDARFRCPTFPRFLPTPVTKRYFHLSILSFSFLFYLSLSLFLCPSSFSIFLALFALADNEIPATDRDAGKENIFWRGKLSRTRHRKHKQTQLERRGKKGRRWNEEGRGIFSRYATEAESTYRQIHNKTIYVFLFLLRSRKCVRSSLSTCLVSGDTGIYNPG